MSVEAKLSRLSSNLKKSSTPRGSSTSLNTLPQEAPESWDDVVDTSPVEAPGPTLKQIMSNEGASPPPPTPVSPQDMDSIAQRWESGNLPTTRYPNNASDRRPEKTTSTANRMIAGALGVKAPKKTEEQKQYDKAMRDAEAKRKNREKEIREQEKLQDEAAKAAVWDA